MNLVLWSLKLQLIKLYRGSYPKPLCFLFFLSLTLTQCAPRMEETSYDLKGGLFPKVAIAPVRVLAQHSVPWNYSEELCAALERELLLKEKLRIIPHTRLEDLGKFPHPSLWQSSDLRLADEFAGLDFLVLCSLVEYQKKMIKTKNARNRQEKILRVKAHVRIINLTQPPYTIAFQEYIEIEDMISPKQEKDSKDLAHWQDLKYKKSHYAIATNKLMRKISDHVTTAVKTSWIRRRPISHLLPETQKSFSW